MAPIFNPRILRKVEVGDVCEFEASLSSRAAKTIERDLVEKKEGRTEGKKEREEGKEGGRGQATTYTVSGGGNGLIEYFKLGKPQNEIKLLSILRL